MTNKQIPRGIRNHNPGNIRYTGTAWKGLATPPTDGAFCIFTEPRFGIRALARALKVYQIKYGICTIAGIINRWAPDVENNTPAYINSVSKQIGVDENTDLDFNDLKIMGGLVRAIIKHENGQQPYTDDQISEGLKC